MDKDWFESKLKGYLHFDYPIGKDSRQRFETYTNDPQKISRWSFYPFLAFASKTKKWEDDSRRTKSKERVIMYASHADSLIYSYYALLLEPLYESFLSNNGISKSVVAFRKLGGKCNIDIAQEAFDVIPKKAPCVAICLDIKGFFDNIDHKILKRHWADLLGSANLPSDHYNIFKSLTQYSYVYQKPLLDALGLSRNTFEKHHKKRTYSRLCEPKDFRSISKNKNLIKKNPDVFGIPQGSPMSALLSNIYMKDFDTTISSFCQDNDVYYLRYCDDLLFIAPLEKEKEVIREVKNSIKTLKLSINDKKTYVCHFNRNGTSLKADKPLQYLGFMFDGQATTIRNSSISRYYSRMKRSVNASLRSCLRNNRRRDLKNVPHSKIFKKTLYRRFSYIGKSSFIRYGYRAYDKMNCPSAMKKQLQKHWQQLRKEIDKGNRKL